MLHRPSSLILLTLITFVVFRPTDCLLAQIPGLYLDRLQVWSVNGSEHSPVSGGYNFTKAWRQTLPNIVTVGLALYNFKTGYNAIFSYKTQALLFNSTSGTVNVELVDSNAKTVYLAFSIVILTEDNAYVELLTFQKTLSSPTQSFPYLYQTSIKFNFYISIPYYHILMDWLTGSMYYSSSSYYNYWAYVYINFYTSTNRIRLRISDSYRIYTTGIKAHVLLVSKNIGSQTTIHHFSQSSHGSAISKRFTYNFGIPSQQFGGEASGYCLHGLYRIDNYVYYTASRYTEVMFVYNGSEVSDLTYQNIYLCRIYTLCLGINFLCPTGQFYNSTQCIPCIISLCQDCSSASQCTQCKSGFISSPSGASCVCPPRTTLNVAYSNCSTCPYDCYTCSSNGSCISCSSSDYRTLDSSTRRCIPKDGYYESNETVASICPSVCIQCQTATICSACVPRYFLNPFISFCYLCPYDCYTCSSNGNCLSCSSSDYRQLNNSRCVPMPGYFESNKSVRKCSSNCISCLSPNICIQCNNDFLYNISSLWSQCRSSCPSNYFKNLNTRTCDLCSYDCYSCTKLNECTSCNDYYYHRQLNSQTKRCEPKKGYYQTYTTKAASCPYTCTECNSQTDCTACKKTYQLNRGDCQLPSSNQLVGIIVGTIVGVSVLCSVVCVVYCCIKARRRRLQIIQYRQRQARQQIVADPEEPRYHAPSQNRRSLFGNHNLFANSIFPKSFNANSWKNKYTHSELNNSCSICLMPDTPVLTVCGHQFHINCISLWSEKKPVCPNCRTKLIGNSHRIICQKCKSKEKVVTMKKLDEIRASRKQNEEAICDECNFAAPELNRNGSESRIISQ